MKSAQGVADEYRQKFEGLKREMVNLKKQIDVQKDQQLQKQAEELEHLKQMMLNKQAQDHERQEFEKLKGQLGTLKSTLAKQQEQPVKDESARGRIQQATNYKEHGNGIISKDNHIYLDQFASNQRSPVKAQGDFTRDSVEQTKNWQRAQTSNAEMTEFDRLMRERENLLKSGVYGKEDLLIKEMDRQIQAAQQMQLKL